MGFRIAEGQVVGHKNGNYRISLRLYGLKPMAPLLLTKQLLDLRRSLHVWHRTEAHKAPVSTIELSLADTDALIHHLAHGTFAFHPKGEQHEVFTRWQA